MNSSILRVSLLLAAAIALGVMMLGGTCAERFGIGISDSVATPGTTTPADADDTVSSDDPVPTPEPTRAVPVDMVKVPAPVESVEIHVAESFPPQYFVEVVSGLPNGCAQFYGYEESRAGNTIDITISNLVPAPSQQVACTEEFRTHRTSIPLGSEFQSKETYTLKVNDTTETFVAQ